MVFNIRKLLILLLFSLSANAENTSTYERLVKGKSCHSGSNQNIDCDYKIGISFWLKIIGVGEPSATVVFMKSDYQASYYATIGKMHGCVIVQQPLRSGEILDVAFISPMSGKIYKSVDGCYAEKKN
jgi:hypothetical protein